MTTKTVQKGQHDFRPNAGLGLRFRGATKVRVEARLTSDCWYDPSDAGPLGRDGRDWNKLGGSSYLSPWRPRTWAKNRYSVLLAWRPATVRGEFEVCAYVNDRRGGWRASPPTTVTPHDLVRVEFAVGRFGTEAALTTMSPTGTVLLRSKTTFGFGARRPRGSVEVGAWFGGTSPAPQNMTVLSNIETA